MADMTLIATALSGIKTATNIARLLKRESGCKQEQAISTPQEPRFNSCPVASKSGMDVERVNAFGGFLQLR